QGLEARRRRRLGSAHPILRSAADLWRRSRPPGHCGDLGPLAASALGRDRAAPDLGRYRDPSRSWRDQRAGCRRLPAPDRLARVLPSPAVPFPRYAGAALARGLRRFSLATRWYAAEGLAA